MALGGSPEEVQRSNVSTLVLIQAISIGPKQRKTKTIFTIYNRDAYNKQSTMFSEIDHSLSADVSV